MEVLQELFQFTPTGLTTVRTSGSCWSLGGTEFAHLAKPTTRRWSPCDVPLAVLASVVSAVWDAIPPPGLVRSLAQPCFIAFRASWV